jgi:hypothetical protein
VASGKRRGAEVDSGPLKKDLSHKFFDKTPALHNAAVMPRLRS